MTKTKQAHYTAQARRGRYPFLEDDLARSVWRRLMKHFPDALAVVLMPDHLHMIAPDRGEAGAALLGKVLGASARTLGATEGRGRLWEPVEPPRVLTSRDKVTRNVRYVWLNPCRPWKYRGREVRLVSDPLRWRWSSLRDTVGAIVAPWTPAARVTSAFGWGASNGVDKLHDYAVGADDVAASARDLPQRPAPSRLPDRELSDVVEAALATTRLPREALGRRTSARRVFLGLAYRQGWRQATELGEICGVHPTTVSKIVAKVPRHEVEIAALCLHPRLRHSTNSIPDDRRAAKSIMAGVRGA